VKVSICTLLKSFDHIISNDQIDLSLANEALKHRHSMELVKDQIIDRMVELIKVMNNAIF
jgi:hypothetical protein